MPAQKFQISNFKFQISPGFTLIELMIAVSIIAIISAIGVTTYSQAQKLGRDSRRKDDLRTIVKALELYYADNQRYPITGPLSGNGWVESTDAVTPWIRDEGTPAVALSNAHINSLPKDPVNDATYRYVYMSSGFGSCVSGRFFILYAKLENTADKDRYGAAPFSVCGSNLAGQDTSYLIAGGSY